MYHPVSFGFKYLHYYISAENGKGHGIHSPFVYDFVTLVLNDAGEYYCFELLEAHRSELLKNKYEIEVQDLGAGSRKGTTVKRRIADIARNALKPPKYSRLLFRMANYFKSHTILELGTSLGITTSYLAYSNRSSVVLTMEGVPAIADLATNQFARLGLENIEMIEGNFDDTLQLALERLKAIDFAYIDGNHRLEPTVKYFKQMLPNLHEDSVVVFDDIHWSEEMEQAWEAVKKEERVTLTIDLFFIGIVFFKKDFKERQHFVIRF